MTTHVTSHMPGMKRSRTRSRSAPARRGRRRIYLNPRALRAITRTGVTTPNVHRYCKWGSPVAVNVGTSGYWYPVTAGLGTLYTAPSVNELDFAASFALSDLLESSQISVLYDQYKIRKIVLHIEMISNPNGSWFINQGSGVSNNSNFYPRVWIIRDHDDNVAPTVAGLASYSRVKERILQPNKSIKISLKPSTLESTYDGHRVVKYNPGWLDMADTTIPHYGIKFAIDFANNYTSSTDLPAKPPTAANPNLSQWEFRVRAQYYFSCKTPR